MFFLSRHGRLGPEMTKWIVQPGKERKLMAKWEKKFAIERQSGVPLLQQITRAVTSDIQRGRLRPGDPLPGTRTLARALGVQRQTVVAAFDELVAEGWIVSQRARGVFVSADLPDPKPRRFTSRESPASLANRTGFELLA